MILAYTSEGFYFLFFADNQNMGKCSISKIKSMLGVTRNMLYDKFILEVQKEEGEIPELLH